MRLRRVAAIVLPPLVLLGAAIGVWYFISYRVLSERRRFTLPPLHRVITEGFGDSDSRAEIFSGLWQSTIVAGIGLGLSIVLGVSIAVAMSQSKLIERAVFPLMVVLQAIPILAMTPLIAMWFETGQKARVIVCIIISIFPIVLNTLFGLVSGDAGLHDLLTLHGVSRWTRLRRLMFPTALPALFAGLRISAGLSVIGAIVGDFFFGRGDKGLGQLIRQYANNPGYSPRLFATVIVSSFLGIVVFGLFGLIQHLAVGKWHDSKSGGGR